ncbi:LOW QUALITY PROTEIN: hypothetical protein V2J09_005944 [Rumex salicifolius]
MTLMEGVQAAACLNLMFLIIEGDNLIVINCFRRVSKAEKRWSSNVSVFSEAGTQRLLVRTKTKLKYTVFELSLFNLKKWEIPGIEEDENRTLSLAEPRLFASFWVLFFHSLPVKNHNRRNSKNPPAEHESSARLLDLLRLQPSTGQITFSGGRQVPIGSDSSCVPPPRPRRHQIPCKPDFLTCLSEGRCYHFPACHILDLCGFIILLDCPLDLLALSVFAPVAAHLGKKNAQASDLDLCINAVPWYKTAYSLHLWDPAFINVVLISSAMGMLGLPFLTREKSFSGKIYATDVTMRFGQLMMDDLISMHREFRQLYGPEDSEWMKCDELERISPALKEMFLSKEWLPLYSTTEVKDCIKRVQPLRYGEESCYNGTLVMRAVSSGLEIGASNWAIKHSQVRCSLYNSVVGSPQAMDFDYHSLQSYDVVIYSDVSSFQIVEVDTTDDVNMEEFEKLEFIWSCAFDSLIAGGSVLIPIGLLGVFLQLFQLTISSPTLRVRIFIISSVSQELFSLLNVVPEWLSKQKQEKLFAGEPLFAHVDLLKEKRMHLIPHICSPGVVNLWQEPCIVLCPHWSLRLGPAVHLLQRWRGDENSLLVLESTVNSDLTLLPFKPVKMKVLQCSFLSGIRSHKILPLMEKLQPKLALFPESSTTLNYTPKLEIAKDLDSQFHGKTFKGYDDANITRLRGELSLYQGKQQLVLGTESSCRSLLYWGTLDIGRLLNTLEKMGIHGFLDQGRTDVGSDAFVVVKVVEPHKGFIELKTRSVVISTGDDKLASALFEAIENTLDSI